MLDALKAAVANLETAVDAILARQTVDPVELADVTNRVQAAADKLNAASTPTP